MKNAFMNWGSCWGRGTKLELVAKPWAYKENSSYEFSQSPVKKRLNQICVSLCLVVAP
jgi:hypothetical protein